MWYVILSFTFYFIVQPVPQDLPVNPKGYTQEAWIDTILEGADDETQCLQKAKRWEKETKFNSQFYGIFTTRETAAHRFHCKELSIEELNSLNKLNP